MLGNHLIRYSDDQLYIGSDKETNSLNLRRALPWELSFAIFTNKGIRKQETHYIRWPNYVMSDDAARITRFDRKRYEELAEDPVKVLDNYEQYLYDSRYKIVMQNGLFYDIYVHRNWREAVGRKEDYSYLSRYIDTIALTKAIQKGWKPDMSNFLAWQHKVMNHREKSLKSSLEFAGKLFQVDHDYNTLHAAGSDVELMVKIFGKQIWQIEV